MQVDYSHERLVTTKRQIDIQTLITRMTPYSQRVDAPRKQCMLLHFKLMSLFFLVILILVNKKTILVVFSSSEIEREKKIV